MSKDSKLERLQHWLTEVAQGRIESQRKKQRRRKEGRQTADGRIRPWFMAKTSIHVALLNPLENPCKDSIQGFMVDATCPLAWILSFSSS